MLMCCRPDAPCSRARRLIWKKTSRCRKSIWGFAPPPRSPAEPTGPREARPDDRLRDSRVLPSQHNPHFVEPVIGPAETPDPLAHAGYVQARALGCAICVSSAIRRRPIIYARALLTASTAI